MDTELLNPQLVHLLKHHAISERVKFLARSELYADYILQAKQVLDLMDWSISDDWVNTVKLLLKHGISDRALYILLATVARSEGKVPRMDFITFDGNDL